MFSSILNNHMATIKNYLLKIYADYDNDCFSCIYLIILDSHDVLTIVTYIVTTSYKKIYPRSLQIFFYIIIFSVLGSGDYTKNMTYNRNLLSNLYQEFLFSNLFVRQMILFCFQTWKLFSLYRILERYFNSYNIIMNEFLRILY